MKKNSNIHPSDDLLTQYAINGNDIDIKKHIETCSVCSDFIKDIKEIEETLRTMPDEDVPKKLKDSILKSAKTNYFSSLYQHSFTNWYKNPFILCIGIMLFAIFLYVFFVFVL